MPAGYSGTPLWKKLGYKPNYRVCVINEPDNFKDLLVEVPEGVVFCTTFEANLNLVHIFTNSLTEMHKLMLEARKSITSDGMIWVSWYKRPSGLPSEIDENAIRNFALANSLVDIKVCAVSDIWSGLKLVIPKSLR
jgi:hypothetical protein